MSTTPPHRPTARNPKTLARFRKQSWWQITFPMIVVVIVLLGSVAGLFFWQGNRGVSVVADYSLILLIIPMLFVGLLGLAAMIGLIYLVLLAMKWIPPYTYIAHQKTFGVRDWIIGIANQITGVIIAIRSFLDGITRYLKERGFLTETPPDAAPGDAGRNP